MATHVCTSEDGRLFCGCGKLVEPGSLRTLKFKGYTGKDSTNPKVEKFLSTGDPSVFD